MVSTRPDEHSGGGRARNRRGEGARLRPEIVQAATDLLDETGTAGSVTLRAVARRVGITAPAIYPHFGDPQAILLAVVEEEFTRLRDHLQSVLAASSEDADERLIAWCDGYLDYAAARPHRYRLLFGGVWDAEPAMADQTIARTEVVELGQALLDDLTALLQATADDGSPRTDWRTDALVLWLGLHGLAHQRIVSSAFPWPSDVQQRLIARLTRM